MVNIKVSQIKIKVTVQGHFTMSTTRGLKVVKRSLRRTPEEHENEIFVTATVQLSVYSFPLYSIHSAEQG